MEKKVERRMEYIGVSIFISLYTLALLSALYTGVETFMSLTFYSLVFILSLVLLMVMIDKLDIPMFKIDAKVAAGTLIATILMFLFVALPMAGGWVRAELAVMSMPPTLQNILTTLLFVSLAESMFKFVIVRSMMAGGLTWTPACLITAVAFALLHSFRYGFAFAPMMYLFIMGFILLGIGRLPKLLGSDVELSGHPVVFAHAAHNIGISAASVLIWY